MVAHVDEWGYTEELRTEDRQFHLWYEKTIDILKETLTLVGNEDFDKNGWSLLAEDKTYGDKAYVKNIEKRGKTFAFTATIPYAIKEVFDISYNHDHQTPHWNPTIAEFKILLEVGNQTNVVYWRSNEVLGGLVSSRDFVDIRCYRKIGDSFVIASGATDYSEMPQKKGCIRAENGFNLFKIAPIKGCEHSKITWLMSSDMKGMLPKAVVERAMRYTMFDYAKHLRLVLAEKCER